jgi:hypothetical protein
MSNTITVRPSPGQREWIKDEQKKTRQKPGAILKGLLDSAVKQTPDNSALITKYAGSVKGLPKNLSTKKGFSR